MTTQQTITTAAALAVTGLAVSLAVASASSRAASSHAVLLLAALSVAVVLAAHLVPALLPSVPRLVLWPTWALCLAGSLYAHAGFLAAAGRDAAAAQLASSPAAAAAARQRADIERALGSIKVRPTAQISRQLSWTTDQSRAAALHLELAEARRADALRDQLIVLSAGTAAAAASATSDPVAGTLAGLLGVSPDAVTLAVSLLLALLIEVIGMLLWREVFVASGKLDQPHDSNATLAPTSAPQAQAAVHQVLQVNVNSTPQPAVQNVQQIEQIPMLFDERELDNLRRAISRGDCSKTVASIRTYLACSSSKARSIRRAVIEA